MSLTFLDTNVLVYAFDRGDLDKQRAAIDLLESADPEDFVISSQVLGEFYTVVTRKLKAPLPHHQAASAVRALSGLTVLPLDASLVGETMDLLASEQLSYWDGLIVAAARRGGCSRILSEDLRAGSVVAGVSIENPF